MILPTEIVAALIGSASSLIVLVIKDFFLNERENRLSHRRAMLQSQIEHAYAPVEFLLYYLVRIDDEARKEEYREELKTILRHYSYLLSEATTSALYVFLEDENTGAALLQPYFFDDFAALKEAYYDLEHTTRRNSFSRKK